MTDYDFPEVDAQGNFISPLVKSRIQELTYTRTGTGRPDQPSTTSGVITGSEPVGTVYNSTGGSGTVAGTWKKTSTGWIAVDDSSALRAETAAKKAETVVAGIEVEIQKAILANPDLRGHDGVSITDVTAVDGVATVSFSNGDKRNINLPKGNDGRSPVITWSGTRIVVDGVTGPDLRGATGPAPTVSWSADKLVVGGQTGPSLTGPQSTTPGPAPSIRIGAVTSGATPSATITGTSPDLTLSLVLQPGGKGDPGNPGAPGALANASTYILVGPGRPDQPATTGGIITGSEPVGAEYRSTDGARVGAWVWRKRPSGWACPDLDTLNRYITADAALLPVGGEAVIRRIGSRVSLVLKGIPRAYKSVIFNIPDGFRSASGLNIGGQSAMGGAGGVFQTVTYQGMGLGPGMEWGGTFIRYHGAAVADSTAEVHASWHSNQAPPASLPGASDLHSS